MRILILSLILNAKQIPPESVKTVEQFEIPLNFFSPDTIIIRKSKFKKNDIHHFVFTRGQQKSIPRIINKTEYDAFKLALHKLAPVRQVANACSRFLEVRTFSSQKYRNLRLCIQKSKNNKDFEDLTNNLIKKYKR